MYSPLVNEKAEDRLYTSEELAAVHSFPFPKHIAIIMDGNRRWAKKEGLPAMAGHWRGADTLQDIVRASLEVGVEVLTVYAFSTENWSRPPIEVKALMRLLKTFFLRQRPLMIEEGIRLNVIGDTSKFPRDVRKILNETIDATKGGEKVDLVIALNYGGRDEIRRAVQNIVQDCLDKKLKKDALTEEIIGSYLDTAEWEDPDLLIRTSGESRVSNFLLWQISYSEVYLTDVLWPDFGPKNFLEAIIDYQKRELRLGK